MLAGEGEVERSGACIHGAVYRRHPDIGAVLHTHMDYATAIACCEGGAVEPLHQNAARFAGRIAYDRDYAGVAFEDDEGERIAALAADAPVVMLQKITA